MPHTAEVLRQILIPFLVVGGVSLAVLMAFLVAQRATRELAFRRRHRLIARYRPLVDDLTYAGPTPEALERLRRTPARHRRIVAELLLAPLKAARGNLVSHVREAVVAMALVEDWLTDLRDRRWWRRADSVRALGFIYERSALPAILQALEDIHEEVRAAAVEAAGRLGDPRAIPPLLDLLGHGRPRRQSRVVDALSHLGPSVTPALVAYARAHLDRVFVVADVLGLIGTVAAIDPLIEWCNDPRGDVRAAALAALGSIGLDDRSYYFALRALGDDDPQARAMAARALGRCGREEAVSRLAERLDDDWPAAAQAAGALRRLGGTGVAALQARASDDGQAGDLARQMLWAR